MRNFKTFLEAKDPGEYDQEGGIEDSYGRITRVNLYAW
jgi:hypothetical protein